MQLSCDGVHDAKSNSISHDVYSVKFDNCQTIYPIRIVRPLKKGSVDNLHQLKLVLDDLYVNNCVVSQFIGDNPKRAFAKHCLCFSSWYPCEYCFAKGTKILLNSEENEKHKEKLQLQRQIVSEKISSLRESDEQNDLAKLKRLEKDLLESEKKIKTKKSNIVWPKTSMNAPPRTREEIIDIVEKIENKQELTVDERKGIIGRSQFLDLPNFNFVSDMPVDYLHCVCIGVVKRCVGLTFSVGENRSRVTKRKLSSASEFNALIYIIKVPRESSRRIRDLDFAVYKAQEYRNLLICFFPLVLDCIEPNAKERHMWLNLVYMIRSCLVPKEEFRPLSLAVIEKCCKSFYSLYQQLFGIKNCTYNTHVVGSHLIEMRYHGPLTSTSAYPFESFYGELRNSYVPGTPSTLKQIMSNLLIKRVLDHHTCEKSIYIATKDTSMECNSMIYCYSQQKYHLYKVISIAEETLTCKVQETLPCRFPEIPSLDWGKIGVFVQGNLSDETVSIPQDSVKGKVVVVKNYLITLPINVLLEK